MASVTCSDNEAREEVEDDEVSKSTLTLALFLFYSFYFIEVYCYKLTKTHNNGKQTK